MMAVRFINYTKEQQRGMSISGYSLYINGNFCCIYEKLTSLNYELQKYPPYNDIEVYPVLARRLL